MIKAFSALVVVSLLLASAIPLANAQRDSVTIAPDGTNLLGLSVPGNPRVAIAITTVRLSRADKLFPVGGFFDQLAQATAVQNLTIAVGTDEVFVWRSVYADLINPTAATIRRQGRDYVLTISCMDGAEAFSAEIFFDSSNVTRRVTRSALTPRVAAEDTRYRMSTLGEK